MKKRARLILILIFAIVSILSSCSKKNVESEFDGIKAQVNTLLRAVREICENESPQSETIVTDVSKTLTPIESSGLEFTGTISMDRTNGEKSISLEGSVKEGEKEIPIILESSTGDLESPFVLIDNKKINRESEISESMLSLINDSLSQLQSENSSKIKRWTNIDTVIRNGNWEGLIINGELVKAFDEVGNQYTFNLSFKTEGTHKGEYYLRFAEDENKKITPLLIQIDKEEYNAIYLTDIIETELQNWL